MKVVVLYKPESEYARQVEEFIHDFEHQTDKKLEVISLDSREGADFAALYDIVQYPALVAVADNGSMLKRWQGPVLPLVNEIAYYT